MSSGSQESSVRERTLEKWTPRLLLENEAFEISVRVCVCVWLPVYSRAHYTKCDAQIDGGPVRAGLPAVAALLVARDGLDLLQGFAAFALLRPPSATSPSPQRAGRHRAAALSLIVTQTTNVSVLRSVGLKKGTYRK